MGLTAILLPQLPECRDDRMQHLTVAAAGSLLLFSESESDVIQASFKTSDPSVSAPECWGHRPVPSLASTAPVTELWVCACQASEHLAI